MSNPEVVNALFDRLDASLPVPVSPGESVRFGILCGCLLAVASTYAALEVRRVASLPDSTVDEYAWIVLLLVAGYACVRFAEMSKEMHYAFRSVFLNEQHFANVHWASRYASALRG